MIQFKRVVSLLVVLGFALPLLTLSAGCGGTSDVAVKVDGPPPVIPPAPPESKRSEKGGGPGSSAGMNFNPGASS